MGSFNLSAWALRNQALIRFLIVLFFLGGIFAYFHLSQKEDPEFTFRTMVIEAYWPGATAQQVEQEVLKRIEERMQEVPGLLRLYGYAKPGEMILNIDLKEGYPKQQVMDSWYQVRKKISDMRTELPGDVIGPFFNDEFGDVFGSIYAITADGFSYREVYDYAQEIRRDLLRFPIISKVNIIGNQPEKIYINFSHQKMATLGIDPQTLINTIRDQNALLPAGVIRLPNNEVGLRLTGNFDSLESIRNLNIHTTKGDFRLGDIAQIVRGYQDPPTFKMHFQGKEAVGLAISMVKDGDVLALGELLRERVKAFQEQLPAGIEIHQVSDQPQVVRHAVSGFMHSLIEAITIVLIISFFSLGFRAGMVVALSIPLVLAISFVAMYFFNVDLQRVSLGALIIAIGLLVDDAMIAVEMMLRKLEEGFDKVTAATFAYKTTAFPMLTGTLVTICGFVPIGLAKSDAGEYTFSIFSVVTISLLVSWLVAVIFTPYIGFKLLKEKSAEQEHDIYQTPIYIFIRRLIESCVVHRKRVILLTIGVFVLSLLGFGLVQQQFFPPSERPEVLVGMWLPEGTPYSTTEGEVNRLEKFLAKDENIVNYTSYIGGSTPRFYLPLYLEQYNINYAQLVIMTKGDEAREEVINKLNNLMVEQFPLVRPQISRLENGPPIGYPLQFRISGKNYAELYKIAEQVKNIVRDNPNTVNVNEDWGQIFTQRVLIDSDKARALNISAQNLALNLQAVLDGYVITKYREGDELIDVEARGTPTERANLATLKDINVYTIDGHYVPVDQVAYLASGTEEGIIWRRDDLPTITVRAEVKGDAQAVDVAMQIDKKLASVRKQLPPGYNIETAGAILSSQTSQASIVAVLPFAIAAMMFLLMLQLHSFQRVILVFITAPLGLIGVTLALLLFHLPFGFVAMLGVISLAGMIMRNSVILIDQIEKYIAEKIAPRDAIIQATVQRFRPIMLTAAAAILAMIPLLQSTFWEPMAAAIMGGLFVATLLTILFLPALYAAWFAWANKTELT